MIHIKNLGNNKGMIWREEWSGMLNGWNIVCEAQFMIMGVRCLVDTIDTPTTHRRKGYASSLVTALQSSFKDVAPIGIEDTDEARKFWAKFDMTDALGEEE